MFDDFGTRSGGNQFMGSLRADLSKPNWRNETPFEKNLGRKREGDLSKIYSGTFGGPILRDRIWFFIAGRDAEVTSDTSLPVTGQSAGVVETNERYEVKLTGALGGNHSIQGSYTDNPVERNLEIQVSPIEMAAIGTNSKRVNYGWVAGYSGILSPSLFAEARYSEKVFGFRGLGGTGRSIQESPMRGRGLLPGPVQALGVSEGLAKKRVHRREHIRMDRSRSHAVQVNFIHGRPGTSLKSCPQRRGKRGPR